MDLVDNLIDFCNTDFSDKPISLGPWGGMGGANWSFNEDGTKVIKQMVIFYRIDLIVAIVFIYEIDGKVEKIKFGGRVNKNSKKQEIDLDFPRKYLTDISGSVDRYIISLKIVTNDTDTEHKPIGAHGKGSPFTLPVHDGMIVGFHGRCGACINSIGVYVIKDANKTDQERPIRIGPWGGSGGSDWTFNETGIAAIKQIVIFLGNANISIAFKQELDGETTYSETFGDPDGSQTYKIYLDWPREYIISISGYVKEHVRSLKIVTNVKEHVPYGREQGLPFTLPVQGGRIVGFHGRCSPYLNSIGVYIKEDKIKVVQDLPVRLGPWGADGGEKWTFNEKNAVINQIVIRCGDDVIDSIAFKYELDEQIISTKRFGGVGGREHKINLEPEEYLTHISGRWSSFTTVLGNTEYHGVTDMMLSTNKEEYGPFGSKQGKGVHFAVPIEGKILGFHGRSSNHLNAIGVYMKP